MWWIWVLCNVDDGISCGYFSISLIIMVVVYVVGYWVIVGIDGCYELEFYVCDGVWVMGMCWLWFYAMWMTG